VAVVACIWIYNAAFNIPMFTWADVHRGWSGGLTCYPVAHRAYSLAARIINFYVPLSVTWSSYVGIIYKFRRSMNKVIFYRPRLGIMRSVVSVRLFPIYLLNRLIFACVGLQVMSITRALKIKVAVWVRLRFLCVCVRLGLPFYVRFYVRLDHFILALFDFIVFDLVSSEASQKIDHDPFCVQCD